MELVRLAWDIEEWEPMSICKRIHGFMMPPSLTPPDLTQDPKDDPCDHHDDDIRGPDDSIVGLGLQAQALWEGSTQELLQGLLVPDGVWGDRGWGKGPLRSCCKVSSTLTKERGPEGEEGVHGGQQCGDS